LLRNDEEVQIAGKDQKNQNTSYSLIGLQENGRSVSPLDFIVDNQSGTNKLDNSINEQLLMIKEAGHKK
jgi:hypothetical protein